MFDRWIIASGRYEGTASVHKEINEPVLVSLKYSELSDALYVL